jgi:uncharacterized protein DUF6484
MKVINQIEDEGTVTARESVDADPLLLLVRDRATKPAVSNLFSGAVIGEFIGMNHQGRTPLVLYPGQTGSAAVAARSVVDLHHRDIGRPVVLMFDEANSCAPIIMGLLRESHEWPPPETPPQVEVDIDGERVVVSGKQQIVLRCGKASITLTREGKVLIQGAYLSSHSSGVNRIKGGSVEIN